MKGKRIERVLERHSWRFTGEKGVEKLRTLNKLKTWFSLEVAVCVEECPLSHILFEQ